MSKYDPKKHSLLPQVSAIEKCCILAPVRGILRPTVQLTFLIDEPSTLHNGKKKVCKTRCACWLYIHAP